MTGLASQGSGCQGWGKTLVTPTGGRGLWFLRFGADLEVFPRKTESPRVSPSVWARVSSAQTNGEWQTLELRVSNSASKDKGV